MNYRDVPLSVTPGAASSELYSARLELPTGRPWPAGWVQHLHVRPSLLIGPGRYERFGRCETASSGAAVAARR